MTDRGLTATGPAGKPRKGLSDGGAYLLLTVAMAGWAGNIVVARAILDVVPPFAFSMGRWVVALMVVLPFVWSEIYAKRAVIARQLPLLFLLGVLAVTLTNGLTYLGATVSTAINASLVNSAAPMLTFAAAFLLHRERPTGQQIQGILLSSLGVLAILAHGNPATLATLNFNWGDLLYFLAVVAWAFYSVLLKRVSPELSPWALITVLFVVGIVTFLPLHLLFEDQSFSDIPLTAPVIEALFYVAFFPSILSFVCWNAAVNVIGANRAGPFNHLNALITVVLAYLFLHEEIAAYHLAGAALIFAGIFLAGRKPRP